MTVWTSTAIPGLNGLWAATTTAAAELQQFAARLPELAAHQPAQLAQQLHGWLTATLATPYEVAGIVAPHMNETVLDAFAQMPLGREVVRILHTVYETTSFGSEQPDVLQRLAAALANWAGKATEAGGQNLGNVLGAGLGSSLLAQTLMAPGYSREDRGARPRGGDAPAASADGAKAQHSGGALDALSGGFIAGVESFGDGIEGAVDDVGKGAAETTVGFCGRLLEGRFGEASATVVRGTDRAIFQSSERLCMGVRDGAQCLSNGVTDAAGPLGGPVRWLTDRLFDIGHTASDTTFGIARDLFRLLPDACTGFIADCERSVRLCGAGEWGRGAAQIGLAFVHVPARLLGGVFDMLMRALQCAASVAQTIVGAEPPGRKLSADERAYLERIYGDSIDYDSVRVKPGGPLNDAMAAHTVGNTMYMPSGYFNKDGTLTEDGLQTLGHEAGHVWQNQNGGGDYIHDALWSQLLAFLGSGDRSNAYDWRQALADGETFETMNAEQRARVMEDLGVALCDDGQIARGEAAYGDDYTDEEIAFLEATAKEVRAGQGAG